MKTLFLLLVGAVSAFPEVFQFGVKAGVPLTDFFTTSQSPVFGFNSDTKRYIVGGTAQLNLPAGFAIVLDALYRRLNYESLSPSVNGPITGRTTGNAWEFPLLLKYRFGFPMARPFVEAGAAWDTLSGLKQSVTNPLTPGGMTTFTNYTPGELKHEKTTGFVLGGGVDFKLVFIHIAPEVRYTRWGSQHFKDFTNYLYSNQNQAEFLLGFTF